MELLLDYLEARGAFDEDSADRREHRPRGPRLSTGETGAVWVLAELVNDDIRPVTLELLGEARELASEIGSSVEALLIGHGVGAQARSPHCPWRRPGARCGRRAARRV